jgi:glutaredoxin
VTVALRLYSRPGCHLCDEMKAVVDRVAASRPVTMEVIDISADPVLEDRHGLEIPVLFVNDRKVAKYRISEEALVRVLDAASQ